jgi:predicted carbohydrate-binding protein with CBM5 and CBM33 domain
MKTLITSILLLISFLSYCQDYTIVQINASWNTRNDVKLPNEINGSKVIYGILEDQPSSIRKSTKAVPIIVIYKNNKPLRQWSADLSFKLNLTKEEIADAIRKDKQTYKRARSN